MKLHEREFFLYKLLRHGYQYNIQCYTLIYKPDNELKLKAQELYLDTLVDASYNDLLSEEELTRLLMLTEHWTNEEENELDRLPHDLENAKIDLFNNFYNPDLKKYHTNCIVSIEKRITYLNDKRHIFDWITPNGVAFNHKLCFLIENGVLENGVTKYDWRDISVFDFLSLLNKDYLSESDIRELARNEPWQSIWRTSNKDASIFGIKSSDLTDDQKKIILWSSFYDSIHENPECPSEDIIDNDSALDGWLILQRRERLQQKHENVLKNKITNDKIANADEVFIIANSQEEINAIHNMNSPNSKHIIKQRMDVLHKKQEIRSDIAYTDTKLKVQMMANNLYRDKIKGN